MARQLIFAANWKMQVTPSEARAFAAAFADGFTPAAGRSYWFFPSAVSIEATARAFGSQAAIRVGAQDIYWEPKGAYTGATSVPLAKGAGATATLVGHSERRHVFGESDADTARKVRAAIQGDLVPFLCVGETLEQREAGETEAVVIGQLRAAVAGLDQSELNKVVLAYEPVWAIGTGRNATPSDAASVHRALRAELVGLGHSEPNILYGGSVKEGNAAALLAETELDGVLVGGASLDPAGWRAIVSTVV